MATFADWVVADVTFGFPSGDDADHVVGSVDAVVGDFVVMGDGVGGETGGEGESTSDWEDRKEEDWEEVGDLCFC